ncbi:hypothetical protein QQX98_011976 [Neonectria punicea]|uniref:HNH nuclease domain-containing protein n=1 Tax=Neonectria punicea TaxID=979145 RepID=A0ABR1GKK1_9HYPO
MLRKPISEPQALGGSFIGSTRRQVHFLHPGYIVPNEDEEEETSDVLISLPAFDNGGIHYDTAHTACAILAGNRWDGYFSSDRGGAARVDQPGDGILRENNYFFHLPSTSTSASTEPYPVIPRFTDWRFPHRNLPPVWRLLQKYLEVLRAGVQPNPSGHCCLSDYADAVEMAHLVPSSLSAWWASNKMASYGRTSLFSTDPINIPANFIPLRSDIHRMFDERHFCMVPKMASSPTSAPAPHLVGHVFNSTPSEQLPKLWHNRELHTLPSVVSVECLFARFAWTIFSPAVFREFLYSTLTTRRLLTWNSDLRKHVIENADPEKCRRIFAAARSRSESPKKRSRGESRGREAHDEDKRETMNEEHDSRDDELLSNIDSGYHGDPWSLVERRSGMTNVDAEEEPERGRTRKREPGETSDGAVGLHATDADFRPPKRANMDAS